MVVPDATTSWVDTSSSTVAITVFDAEANRWEEETVEDVIDVKLTDPEKVAMLVANGADENAKTEAERRIDSLKADLKAAKTEHDAIAARIRDRNLAGLRGTESRRGTWRLLTCFSLGVCRYVDPETGRVMHERALTPGERQQTLKLADVVPIGEARKSDGVAAGDEEAISDPEALLEAARRGDEIDLSDDGDDEGDE